MADLKISQMPDADLPLAGTEIVPLVQSGVNKKVTVADLGSGISIEYDDISGKPDLSKFVESDTTGITGATVVTNVVIISQADYDALGTKDASTLYAITD
jgi:hypothetical protein